MQKGQLAMLPAADGRRTERRIVNLAASLREPGATLVDADVVNLSTTGFMAQTDVPLQVGQFVFLKLPGLEAAKSSVVWVEEGKAGFEFISPLHPAVLEQITAVARKAIPRNHFGPRR